MIREFKYPAEAYNTSAAEVVLPLVFGRYRVRSVLDVGCGLGTWLAVSKTLGVETVVGLDSSTWNASFQVQEAEFRKMDLSEKFDLLTRFDLAICLEVAEHLPEEKSDTLIDSLALHADMVLFSAAIPGQGGAEHLNEQWPNYWQQKFQRRGFLVSDFIRPLVWENTAVQSWYRQNILLFLRQGSEIANRFPIHEAALSLVHPEIYDIHLRQSVRLSLIEQGKGSVKLLLKYLLHRFRNMVKP